MCCIKGLQVSHVNIPALGNIAYRENEVRLVGLCSDWRMRADAVSTAFLFAGEGTENRLEIITLVNFFIP